MNYLTKTMKMPVSDSLLRLLGKIKSPRDLYRGVCPQGSRTPKNLLLFSRQQKKDLQPREQHRFQHRRFVLILNLKTTGSVAIDGHWHKLSPGEALLVFPYQVHAFGRLEAASMSWLFVTFEQDSFEGMEILRQRAVAFGRSRRMTLWLEQIMAAWEDQGKTAAIIAHLGALLLAELHRLAAASRPAKKRRSAKPGSSSRPTPASTFRRGGPESLLPLIHEIVEQKDPACRIKDLARRLGLSESHLRAEFRRQVGHSLGHYLKQIRLSRAASLLAGTSLRVGEIADRSGFDSLYSFSRFFRKAMGQSPRDYRKSL